MSVRQDKVFNGKLIKSIGTIETPKANIDTVFFSLWELASNGKLGDIKILLEKYPQVVENHVVSCYSAVFMAARYGHLPVVNFLLEFPKIKNHFITHVSDKYDHSLSICPLRAAAEKGKREVVNRLVQVLVESGAPVPSDIIVESNGMSENVAKLAEKFKKPIAATVTLPIISVSAKGKLYVPSSRAYNPFDPIGTPPVTQSLQSKIADVPKGVILPRI